MIARQTITLNGKRFGALLDYTRAGVSDCDFDLTIILRICLVQNGGMILNPGQCQYYGDQSPSSDDMLLERVVGTQPDYDRTIYMLEDWDVREWRGFCNLFVDDSISFWNNRFRLSSRQSVTGRRRVEFLEARSMRSSASSAPMNTVNCKFRLELTSNEEHAHKVISVYKISPLERASSFRSDDAHYVSDDLNASDFQIVDPNPELAQEFSSQRTFIHEVGHAIGLEHVGIVLRIAGCSQNQSGTSICYGNTYETSMNVMGRGEDLSWREALPWRTALAQLTDTNADGWEVYVVPQLT